MSKSADLFRHRLKAFMESEGFTYREMAVSIGIARSAIQRWLAGEGEPSLDAVEHVARLMRVTVSELLDPESEAKPKAAPREIVDIIDSAYAKNDQPLIRAVEALLLGLAAGRAESSLRSAQVPAHHRKQKK